MFKKAKKVKSNYYFDSFPVLAGYSVKCGEIILDFMKHFDYKRLEEIKNEVHEIEHQADNLKHEVTDKLLKEFMTPVDREDIYQLLKLIDDVTDAIEEISLKLYIYDYKELPRNTIEFTELTLECMKEMQKTLEQMPHYLDNNYFVPYVLKVVDLEEKCDEIHAESMRYLYQNETDGFKRHKAEAMYNMLEEVSDKCCDAVKFVQNIALKNI